MNDASHATSPITPRIVAAAAVLCVHFVALLLVILVLCFVVPKYTNFFEGNDLELPEVTIQLVNWSLLAVNYWYLILFLGMGADAAIVVGLTLFASKRQWLVSTYSHLWLLVVMLFLAWASIALSLPIITLGDG